ncbi:MAG: flagellar motor protein MotA [Methylocella sp.]
MGPLIHTRNDRPGQLSAPLIFLVRMLAFLILAGFCALILHRQIITAFMANPGLNGLIIGVLAFGIIMGLRQVIRLFREVRWVNALLRGEAGRVKPPVLLAPVASLIGDKPLATAMAPAPLRAVLDTIGARLDEARDTARYLTGLLIFLGLLGTFWGLLETVGSIGGVIKSMQTGSDAAVMFDDLKNGLSAPIAGMSISFTSSLFGLAGSLVLGFLDLQAGQAQNRFFTELEDSLTAISVASPLETLPGLEGMSVELRIALEKIAAGADQSHAKATSIAVANLAEGVQSLVQHMRSEQQIIRDWVEAQAEQNREVKVVLQSLAAELKERN